MSKDYFTIPIEYHGREDLIRVSVYDSKDTLRKAIAGLGGAVPDAIAYTHTYSCAEDKDVAARLYFVAAPSVGTIAHESTHLALGLLSRLGYSNLEVTTDVAPAIEEKLCGLVGDLTSIIKEDLDLYGSAQKEAA